MYFVFKSDARILHHSNSTASAVIEVTQLLEVALFGSSAANADWWAVILLGRCWECTFKHLMTIV
jgi:hypothetical protein